MTSALKDAREKLGIDIDDVAKDLKIRRKYLIALEENKLGDIPGYVYAQGYQKMYATYLGLNLDECNLLQTTNNSSVRMSGSDYVTKYSVYKASISFFLIGILSIFCWYSITDKVLPDSEHNLLDKLSECEVDEKSEKIFVLDSNLINTALGRIPIGE